MTSEWLNTLDINSEENNLGWKYRFRNSQWSHGMDKRAQGECLLWEEGSEKNWEEYQLKRQAEEERLDREKVSQAVY